MKENYLSDLEKAVNDYDNFIIDNFPLWTSYPHQTSSLPAQNNAIWQSTKIGHPANHTNEEILEAMDIKDIEKFLRKKKLEKINKK